MVAVVRTELEVTDCQVVIRVTTAEEGVKGAGFLMLATYLEREVVAAVAVMVVVKGHLPHVFLPSLSLAWSLPNCGRRAARTLAGENQHTKAIHAADALR